jgi:hypothetical protein
MLNKFLLLALLGSLPWPLPTYGSEERSSHVDFESWSLDYEINDDTGLVLRNVLFAQEKILAKASMPVIRDKYDEERHWWDLFSLGGSREGDGRCGPFQNRLSWTNIIPIADCNDAKVCVQTQRHGGVKWMELGVYARIGEYHIYQVWYLSEDGELRPVVHIRGLSCNTNHVHHVYWRLDFDIDGNALDQVFRYDTNAPDAGWGRGWHKYTNEVNDTKLSATKRTWLVRDQPTGHGVWIFPGTDYGPITDESTVRDAFSDIDVAVRHNKRLEDEPWPFGARGELAYDDGEGIQEQDIVFWYIAHLPHPAVMGATKWLAIGPTLRIGRGAVSR